MTTVKRQPGPAGDKTIRFGEREFPVLFPGLLPTQTEEARAELYEDIRARGGAVVPVVVDEAGNVIDGATRLAICAKLGLPVPPLDVRTDLTTLDQKRDLALALNERRRHLTADDLHRRRQERIGRVEAARQGGKSTRAIAEQEGVSQTQVCNDLQAAGEQGCSPEPDLCDAKPGVSGDTPGKVKGQDGKTYPASKPPSAARQAWDAAREDAAPELADLVAARKVSVKVATQVSRFTANNQAAFCEEVRAGDPAGVALRNSLARHAEAQEPARDALGTVIPPRLLDAFADTFLQDTAAMLEQMAQQILSAAATWCPYLKAVDLAAKLRAAAQAMLDAVPYAVHAGCGGAGCGGCLGCGWVPRAEAADWAKREHA